MRIAVIVGCCTAEPNGHALISKLQDVKPDAAGRITRRDRLNAVVAGQRQPSRAVRRTKPRSDTVSWQRAIREP